MAKPKKKKRRTNNGTARSITRIVIDFLLAIASQVLAAILLDKFGY